MGSNPTLSANLSFFPFNHLAGVAGSPGEPEQVIPIGANEVFYGPRLLPGGEWVIFSVRRVGRGLADPWDTADIVAASLVSDDRRTVWSGGSDVRYVSSGHLLYVFENVLYAVAFDPGTLEVSGSPTPVVPGIQRSPAIASGAAFYDIATDGTLVYVPGNISTLNRRLTWVDRDGRQEIIDSVRPGSFGSPRLSPDGTRVLLWESADAHIAELGSGRLQRVTTNARGNAYGAWSPDGERIAYSFVNEEGSRDIWTEAADGSDEPRLLATSPGDLDVESFSPDGRVLAFHRHERTGSTNEDLFVIEVDATDAKPREFVADEFATFGAVFSPDSRYIAYVSDESGRYEVYVRPFPGPGGVRIVSNGGGIEPAWKGGEIFYRRYGDRRMMVVEIETTPTLKIGRPAELFGGDYYPAPGSDFPMAQYDVTPDGQRFLALSEATDDSSAARPRVVTVHNWFTELERVAPTD